MYKVTATLSNGYQMVEEYTTVEEAMNARDRLYDCGIAQVKVDGLPTVLHGSGMDDKGEDDAVEIDAKTPEIGMTAVVRKSYQGWRAAGRQVKKGERRGADGLFSLEQTKAVGRGPRTCARCGARINYGVYCGKCEHSR